MNYSAINIQGNIISLEILDKIRNEENYPHQKPKDFGFEKGTSIRDKIGNAWSEAKILWELYSKKMEKLPEGDYGTTETRKLWMTPFLFELGYDIEISRAEEINGKSFPVSHRDAKHDGFPLLIMGYQDKLDRKPEGSRLRMSPHALMQEYLNHTEHLYGLVINGTHIRLLRDSNRLSKLAYLEFDIGKMVEEDLFYEFAIMYRVIHASRIPKNQDEIEKAVFEFYHQESIDSGARIRKKLRSAVKESMELLTKGFLFHPENEVFVEKVRNREIKAEQFYKILLRTIYRIIFLATIEERNLVYEKFGKDDPDYEKKNRLRNIFLDYYSFERLRNLALSPVYIDPRRQDLWQSLLATFRLFEPLGEGEKLGIKPLGGELFGNHSLSLDGVDFYELRLHNSFMLEILGRLTTFRDERKQLTRVNYRDLDVEELGSVYEALLELQPYFNTELATPAFSFTEGSLRKLTGSYYTRHDLVAQLIKTALIPVMEDRLKAAKTREEKIDAILNISVCDPAAGSGHFLLAASRVLGYELARISTNEENPGEEPVLEATRDVIESCIYGVDKNPAAVELCRLSLWLVAHNSGKPLTFLEHKIKCGDSLVGVDDLKRLTKGIPDGAFKPVTGDDKKTAGEFKKLNSDFLKKKQLSLFAQSDKLTSHQQLFADKYRQLVKLHVNTQEDYENKRSEYHKIIHNPQLQKDRNACNLFTYAFFQSYEEGQEQHETITSEMLAQFLNSAGSINARLEAKANAKEIEYRFFHWPIEFPDIVEKGGFDVIIGNPPWEKIKLQEKEFFSLYSKEISLAENKHEREKIIKRLPEINPVLYQSYKDSLKYSMNNSKFIRGSKIFPLSAKGDINTYAIFTELFYNNLKKIGRISLIIPTGIATDENTSTLFGHLVNENHLISYLGFKNEKFLFPKPVEHTVTFGILTVTKERRQSEIFEFCWLAYTVEEMNDLRRRIKMKKDELTKVNPNTNTSPIPWTQFDANLLSTIYNRIPILINLRKNQNSWEVNLRSVFHMSNDSRLFSTDNNLNSKELKLLGNIYIESLDKTQLPLYESKFVHIYDHRFGSYENIDNRNITSLPTPEKDQYQNSNFLIEPWYWVKNSDVYLNLSSIPKEIKKAYKTNKINELNYYLLAWRITDPKILPQRREQIINTLLALNKKKKRKAILSKVEDYKSSFPLSVEEVEIIDELNDDNPYDVVLDIAKIRTPKWLFGFRNVARSTDIRTGIFSAFPLSAVGNSLPIILWNKSLMNKIPCLIGNFSCLVFDWIVRQKVAGVNMNFFFVEQFAVIPPEIYFVKHVSFIAYRVYELIYSSWDIKAFADDVWKEADQDLRKAILQQWQKCKASTGGHTWLLPEWKDAYPEIHWHSPFEQAGWSEEDLLNYNDGCPLPPFKWDEDRRAQLKAELDAYYTLLYGLDRDELRYILDPQDVYGEDFPGETFRVLKEKETKKYGEYRTRRLVLEAYDRLSPSWDMEAHLKRLKEVWEEYQVDLNENKDKKYKVLKKVSKAAEPESVYRQPGLFDEPNLFNDKDTE